MSSFGAMWRNCSLSFCNINELLDSSEMYCFELLTKVDCSILFKISAKLVPR